MKLCDAFETDHSQPLEIKVDEMAQSEASQKMKIGLYFATWWSLNVVSNLYYYKKDLNAFPFPWLTSTLSLVAGSHIMLVSWQTLFWVALAHIVGHVIATLSISKVAVSFTHIAKSREPTFSVLVSRLCFDETFPFGVYLSLLPIIGGCALSALTELNFNIIGMKGKSVSGLNYYACFSMLCLLILTPFTIAMEGPEMWEVGWQITLTQIWPNFVWWVVAQSMFYHLYNQISHMSLDRISPLTFSTGNTMKCISIIIASIIIFRTPIVNVVGVAIAILGIFIYSQVKP